MISRREALGILSASLVASAQETPLRFTALDHIETSAPDAAKSAAFYAAIFGGPIWKNNKSLRRYVKLGPRYIAIENAREPLGIDHFSAGIEGFNIAEVHRFLEQRGIEYKDYPSGRDLNVADPDGIHLQLSADNTWAQLSTGTASPETATSQATPIFAATGIDHILLNVADPEKSAVFYAEIFGPVTQRNNNRIWFQVGKSRVGLLKTPAGAKPGVNHFCVSAAAFDENAATKKLAAAGARIEKPEVPGSTEFRDPDGLLVQVMAG
jgi:catechol 2,3-dioxygenase-like lactoylglutathione lyase family enzyme